MRGSRDASAAAAVECTSVSSRVTTSPASRSRSSRVMRFRSRRPAPRSEIGFPAQDPTELEIRRPHPLRSSESLRGCAVCESYDRIADNSARGSIAYDSLQCRRCVSQRLPWKSLVVPVMRKRLSRYRCRSDWSRVGWEFSDCGEDIRRYCRLQDSAAVDGLLGMLRRQGRSAPSMRAASSADPAMPHGTVPDRCGRRQCTAMKATHTSARLHKPCTSD